MSNQRKWIKPAVNGLVHQRVKELSIIRSAKRLRAGIKVQRTIGMQLTYRGISNINIISIINGFNGDIDDSNLRAIVQSIRSVVCIFK